MARKPKSNRSAIWDAAGPADQLVVNPSAPTEALRQRSGKARRAATYGIAFVGIPLALIMGINTLASPPDAGGDVAAVDSVSVNSSIGKAAAVQTVSDWLAGDPAPVPGGTLISWDGFDPIAGGVSANAGAKPADPAELHHFTVAARAGSTTVFYTATVLVSVDDTLGAKVVGTPSLIPRSPAAQTGWSTKTWPGYVEVQVSDSIVDAVEAWADAFTGEPAQLRIAVGDKDADHAYIPLAGATVTAVEVTAAGHPETDDGSVPPDVIARVALTVNWDGGAKGAAITYDVLVEDARTAAPVVVAWGGAGTGPTLTKHQNAVSGKVAAPPAPTGTPNPTSTPEVDD